MPPPITNPFAVTDEERGAYTRIIDGILAAADLETVTRKKIRQGLEEAIDKDLSDQKVCVGPVPFRPAPVTDPCQPKQIAIKNLIEARFDAISSAEVAQVPTPTSGATADHDTNGHSPSDDDTGANGEIKVSLPPPTKKQKRESSSEDADARLAAELQAQENRLSRGRVTRGAGVAKPKPRPKTTKKKSAKRVRSDDDSDAGSDPDAKPKRKAGGGFQKPFNLSFPLAELCGENQVRVHASL
jgi:upstream activation factor subunit UAF30